MQAKQITTVLDAVVAAVSQAGLYNKNDQVAPEVVLWTDKDRQWEALLPALRGRLPLLTFDSDNYVPDELRGPAYWVRCMLAGTLAGSQMPAGQVPILYLPGVGKADLRGIEECPKPLQPLAELQYRGVVWTQKNGRDWTIAAFIQTKEGGLDISVGADNATKDALLRALPVLANEPVARLRKAAPLRSGYLDELLNPDDVRRLLLWMNDPTEYREQVDNATWTAFCSLAQQKYGFHPEKDGTVTAAEHLGADKGAWKVVWERYCEAPTGYPNIAGLLRRARPQLGLFEKREPYWPQDNESAEASLRERLVALGNALPADVCATLADLETEHAARRTWIWAKLGETPLAIALGHLVDLAQRSVNSPGGATVEQIAANYTEHGWQVDTAALNALAAVRQVDDTAAVRAVIRALYRPWLEQGAKAMQQAVVGNPAKNYVVEAAAAPAPGTCIVFVDALRYDVGQQLISILQQQGMVCKGTWRLAALPTVTPTAKPAAAPIGALVVGDGRTDLTPAAAESHTPIGIAQMRSLLADVGFQVLSGDELGDPAGIGWTELGAIDQHGHQHGWKLAHRLNEEMLLIRDRIAMLLNHGWREVIVTTDHGWLLLPGNLPKVALPIHASHLRKGRCAVLKDGADTDQQSVPWHWDKNVHIALASGIACYEDGKEYEHGGISPQECIVPLISVTKAKSEFPPVKIENVSWRGLRCYVKLDAANADVTVDIRTQAGNAASSLAIEPKSPDSDGNVSLLVEEEDRAGSAVIVVVLAANGTVVSQMPTIVGA
ncbi:MAG: BREX-1 system phosphatase PglZ type B [Caldilineaceae bacterium]|nr:BREX-1 system phosphatase PglZ type B [Caldilineaceae bacterium]